MTKEELSLQISKALTVRNIHTDNLKENTKYLEEDLYPKLVKMQYGVYIGVIVTSKDGANSNTVNHYRITRIVYTDWDYRKELKPILYGIIFRQNGTFGSRDYKLKDWEIKEDCQDIDMDKVSPEMSKKLKLLLDMILQNDKHLHSTGGIYSLLGVDRAIIKVRNLFCENKKLSNRISKIKSNLDGY